MAKLGQWKTKKERLPWISQLSERTRWTKGIDKSSLIDWVRLQFFIDDRLNAFTGNESKRSTKCVQLNRILSVRAVNLGPTVHSQSQCKAMSLNNDQRRECRTTLHSLRNQCQVLQLCVSAISPGFDHFRAASFDKLSSLVWENSIVLSNSEQPWYEVLTNSPFVWIASLDKLSIMVWAVQDAHRKRNTTKSSWFEQFKAPSNASPFKLSPGWAIQANSPWFEDARSVEQFRVVRESAGLPLAAIATRSPASGGNHYTLTQSDWLVTKQVKKVISLLTNKPLKVAHKRGNFSNLADAIGRLEDAKVATPAYGCWQSGPSQAEFALMQSVPVPII